MILVVVTTHYLTCISWALRLEQTIHSTPTWTNSTKPNPPWNARIISLMCCHEARSKAECWPIATKTVSKTLKGTKPKKIGAHHLPQWMMTRDPKMRFQAAGRIILKKKALCLEQARFYHGHSSSIWAVNTWCRRLLRPETEPDRTTTLNRKEPRCSVQIMANVTKNGELSSYPRLRPTPNCQWV